MMHMYCFGSRWLLPRCAVLVASPAPTKGDHPTVPLWQLLFPNRSALCHILRVDRLFALCYKGLPASRKSRLRDGMMSADSQHEQGRAPGQSARQYG